MSLEMLKMEKEQGVDIVVATPHFYADRQSVDEFIQKREKAFNIIKDKLSDNSFPEVFLGAEVYYTPLLSHLDLSKLTINNTKYILLELPYQKLDTRKTNEIVNFISSVDVFPVIAHIERYLDFTSEESLDEFISTGT